MGSILRFSAIFLVSSVRIHSLQEKLHFLKDFFLSLFYKWTPI